MLFLGKNVIELAMTPSRVYGPTAPNLFSLLSRLFFQYLSFNVHFYAKFRVFLA